MQARMHSCSDTSVIRTYEYHGVLKEGYSLMHIIQEHVGKDRSSAVTGTV
jgi:hypothetical protein